MKNILHKYGLLALKLIIVILTPIVPSLIFLGFFVAMDLITGLIKARKTFIPITSKGLSQTVTKLLLYYIAIICSHILDTQYLANTILPAKITQLVTGFIMVVEFKSVIENISEILGLPLWQFIKSKIYREASK